MTDTVISIENLGKKYRIQHQGEDGRYVALRDVIANKIKDLFRNRKSQRDNRQSVEDFWALKEFSFDVKQGEVVGIIGRNGAGKGTLLKILSRITEPTEGRVRIKGRVASLLEVGTGFHPELTGRENIFLNGAILGMTRMEMKRKYDDIVAFAEVEKFLDTPVKRYSSGMYVRLAFAVAAHLEPEILIVDEVLAVGDAQFQKKCLGKISEASRTGRTVLFVSHTMTAIQSLCSRAVLMDRGRLVANGEPTKIIRQYLAGREATAKVNLTERTDREGDGSVRLQSVTVEAADGTGVITSTTGMKIKLNYSSKHEFVRPKILIGIYDGNETGIYGLDSEIAGGLPDTLPPDGTVTCITAPVRLTAGPCFLNVAFFNGGNIGDYVQRAAEFDIEPADFFGTGKMPNREWMVGLIEHEWNSSISE